MTIDKDDKQMQRWEAAKKGFEAMKPWIVAQFLYDEDDVQIDEILRDMVAEALQEAKIPYEMDATGTLRTKIRNPIRIPKAIGSTNPIAYISRMRALVKENKTGAFMDLLRRFNIANIVHFRMTQLKAPSVGGEFTDGTGDGYITGCIETLPPKDARDMLAEFIRAQLHANRGYKDVSR